MKTIQITTAHNVAIEFEQAQLRERIFAFLIDCMAMWAIWMVFSTIFLGVLGMGATELGPVFSIAPILFFWFWMAGWEALANGQTLGKRALKIRTVRLDGRRAGWSELILRAFLHLLDTLLCGGFIGFLLIKTTEKGQRLGDLAAGTCVIRLRPELFVSLSDVLSIGTTATQKVHFPQARALREADVLAIKNCLAREHRYRNRAHQEMLIDVSERVAEALGIEKMPFDRAEFLRTVVRDYVLLTR